MKIHYVFQGLKILTHKELSWFMCCVVTFEPVVV